MNRRKRSRKRHQHGRCPAVPTKSMSYQYKKMYVTRWSVRDDSEKISKLSRKKAYRNQIYNPEYEKNAQDKLEYTTRPSKVEDN